MEQYIIERKSNRNGKTKERKKKKKEKDKKKVQDDRYKSTERLIYRMKNIKGYPNFQKKVMIQIL